MTDIPHEMTTPEFIALVFAAFACVMALAALFLSGRSDHRKALGLLEERISRLETSGRPASERPHFGRRQDSGEPAHEAKITPAWRSDGTEDDESHQVRFV